MANIQAPCTKTPKSDSSLEQQFLELVYQYETAVDNGVILTNSQYDELDRRYDELCQKLDDSLSTTEKK